MSRLFTEIKTNIRVQFRNGLYYIGISVGIIIAIAMSQLVKIEYLPFWTVGILLLIVGGSTFLYVAAMILFEKDEGTIAATLTSPLTSTEYITAKIVSLVILASLEATTMFCGSLLILYFMGFTIVMPNIFMLILSLIVICIIFVEIGIVMIVRYRKITDFFMPMLVVITVLQIPLLYFVGMSDNWLMLLIPVSPPTMLMLGAFDGLTVWQYIYAFGYSILCIAALGYWAKSAFNKHIVGEV